MYLYILRFEKGSGVYISASSFCNRVENYNNIIWKPFINDIEHVIYEADALMYEEKRAYYASNKK